MTGFRTISSPLGAALAALVLLVGAGALTPTAQARGHVTAELKSIVETCKTKKDKIACERALWTFADVTKDDKITIAEITRFMRALAKGYDKNLKAAKGDRQAALIYSVLIGPIAAYFLISNFDYDGDNKISRKELYFDAKEGDLDAVLSQLVSSGEGAVADAMGVVSGSLLGGLMGVKGDLKPRRKTSRAKQSARRSQAKTPPLAVADWSASFAKKGIRAYYSVTYRLQNKLDKDIKDVKGSITFQDPAGLRILRIGLVREFAIPAGKFSTSSGRHRVYATTAQTAKLTSLPKSSITVILKIDKVTLADGSVINYR